MYVSLDFKSSLPLMMTPTHSAPLTRNAMSYVLGDDCDPLLTQSCGPRKLSENATHNAALKMKPGGKIKQ